MLTEEKVNKHITLWQFYELPRDNNGEISFISKYLGKYKVIISDKKNGKIYSTKIL